MNAPLQDGSRLEVRDASGQLVGYFVPVAELDQIESQAEELRSERDALKKMVDDLPRAPP